MTALKLLGRNPQGSEDLASESVSYEQHSNISDILVAHFAFSSIEKLS